MYEIKVENNTILILLFNLHCVVQDQAAICLPPRLLPRLVLCRHPIDISAAGRCHVGAALVAFAAPSASRQRFVSQFASSCADDHPCPQRKPAFIPVIARCHDAGVTLTAASQHAVICAIGHQFGRCHASWRAFRLAGGFTGSRGASPASHCYR